MILRFIKKIIKNNKNSILKIGVIIMSLAMLMEMAGCSNKHKRLFNMIEDYLQNKYGEKFTANSVEKSYDFIGDDSYYVICSPQSDETLKFKAKINPDFSVISDLYTEKLVCRKLETVFEKGISDSIGNASVFFVTLAEGNDNSDINIDIDDYIKLNSDAEFLGYMAIPSSVLNSNTASLFYTVINEISVDYPKLIFGCLIYTFSDDSYKDCISYLKNQSDVNTSWFSNFNIKNEYKISASDKGLIAPEDFLTQFSE